MNGGTVQDQAAVPLLDSFVQGSDQPPLLEGCIGAALDRAAGLWPNDTALIVRHQDIRWTFSQLAAKATHLAAHLLALGLRPGERVGVLSQNNAQWVLAQFGTAKAGLIQVNINPALRTAELAYVLNTVGCRALIVAPTFRSSDYLAMLRELAPELACSAPGELHARAIPALRWIITLGAQADAGTTRFDDLLKPPGASAALLQQQSEAALRPTDPINIQFTSGTTGAPKGATLTHRNILNNALFVGAAIRLGRGDRVCIPVPLYHCFGMVMANLACVVHGACMVQPAEHFEPGAVLACVAAERCTALYGVPTMFAAILNHPEFGAHDLASLRTGIMAGAPCPMEIMRSVVDRMHMAEITIAYGMTETSPVSFQSAWNDPIETRVATVGCIAPHLQAKIVNVADEIVPRGQTGELMVRGYSVMHGYWNDAASTAAAIDADGWMRTGDLGSIDAQGLCRILGRSKEMIIRGGENIYPVEIEAFLYRHPDIAGVQCIGIPDELFGEELCACVIARPGAQLGAEDVRAFCKDRIAHYKIPRYIRIMDEFPMTVTGKVQKFRLREIVLETLQA